ncbi:MAG: alpha-galactosidase [Pseudonocardia sp.]|jgi:alpha-galactosidase|nr:alpha-galactosidase [Pseudonocardia sp.]
MRAIAELAVEPALAVVYEHGWQSWSPTRYYRLTERPHRPISEHRRLMNYRPERVAPPDAYWGEGLLAVDPGTGGGVHIFAAADPAGPISSIQATARGDRVLVSADGELTYSVDTAAATLEEALGRWATEFAGCAGVATVRQAPTLWCSWYHYFTAVTQADIDENLLALDELELDIDVVQIDDGYQAELGDWLALSDRFTSLRDTVSRIHDHGRRAGIWVAPFLVGERSALRRDHPEWLVGGVSAGHGWEQELAALDTTHPEAERYLFDVFSYLHSLGIDFFKIDFVYAGALEGVRADPTLDGVRVYRRALQTIRAAIGPDSYLLGCGAPVLPSVGLVDAMRVSPDIAHYVEPPTGDMSEPSQRAAAENGQARAWQHGRFWVNDPDCLIAAPIVEQREAWAQHVERYGGLRASSDRLHALDDWGLATTRRLVVPVRSTPLSPWDGGL